MYSAHSQSTMANSDCLTFPRQVGGDKGGKINKNTLITKRYEKSSSIPSKYSTTLFDRSKISGFGCSDDRFKYSGQFEEPTPGPACYTYKTEIQVKSACPSYSKKGYGNFASIADRCLSDYLNKGPGPGHYNSSPNIFAKPSAFESQNNIYRSIRHDMNYNQNRECLKEVSQFQKFDARKNLGPGSYEPKQPTIEKNPGHYLQSMDDRNMNQVYNKSPGPANYNLTRQISKKKPYPHNGVLSSFSPTVLQHKINLRNPYDMRKEIELDLIGKKKIVPDDLKVPGPGPGEYECMQSFKFLKDYKAENYRGNKAFLVDDHNRFGVNDDQQVFVNPGPGQYEIDKQVGVNKEKSLVSGAVFLSETDRKPYGDINQGVGPNKYCPNKIPDQISFNFNIVNKWI